MGCTNMPGMGTMLICLTCALSFIAFILHAVSFSMPNWLESVRPSPFDKIGWHRACFSTCRYPYCPGGDQFIYDGCWWIYDYYFKEVKDWLRRDWFLHARLMAILVIPVAFIGFLLTAFATCVVGYWRYPRRKTPSRDHCLTALMLIAAGFLLVAAVLMLLCLGEFAMNCFSHDWMPMPDKNSLGYSFWIEVASLILVLISVLTAIVSVVFKNIGAHSPKELHVAEDMMMGMDTLRKPPLPPISEEANRSQTLTGSFTMPPEYSDVIQNTRGHFKHPPLDFIDNTVMDFVRS